MSTRGLNNLHRYLIMQSDLLSSKRGKREDVKKAFDKAIATAGKAGFTQDAALANELAAEYFLKIKDDYWPNQYLSRACELYNEWGAAAKVEQIKKVYATDFDLSRLTLHKSTMTSSVRYWVSGEESDIHKAIDFDMLSRHTELTDLTSAMDAQSSWQRRKSGTSATLAATSATSGSIASASNPRAQPTKTLVHDIMPRSKHSPRLQRGKLSTSTKSIGKEIDGPFSNLSERKKFLVNFAASKQVLDG